MRVLYAHQTGETGERSCIAFVDVELNEHVRLYGLRLLRQPHGRYTISAPTCGRRQSSTFSKLMAEHLTALALEALEAVHG